MSIDVQAFKDTLASWASGVTVVTTTLDQIGYGITVSSFTSLSLQPPLVLVCIGNTLYTKTIIEQSGVFAVNILSENQVALGKRFAGLHPEITDRFADLDCQSGVTGCPILPDVLGWLECRVVNATAGGDHTIYVGEVVAQGNSRVNAGALVYHNRQWGRFDTFDQED